MNLINIDRSENALCLSGGGFRATLFHLGGLIRLNELGWLRNISAISSVSGGSVAGAFTCLKWNELRWENGTAVNLYETVIEPLRKCCTRDIDTPVTALNALVSLWGGTHDHLAALYDRYLFSGRKLKNLPDSPECLILGCDIETGLPVVFHRHGISVDGIGDYVDGDIRLSTAVAVSCAYPAYLSPVTLKTDISKWKFAKDAGSDKQKNDVRKLVLTDGGMYDPLAVFPVINKNATLLVSDASQVRVRWRTGSMWLRQLARTTLVQTFGNSGMTRTMLEKLFEACSDDMPAGVVWSSDRRIDGYDVPEKAILDSDETASVCRMRTRLSTFTETEQNRIINWGYALCDAAMRERFGLGNEPPAKLPYA